MSSKRKERLSSSGPIVAGSDVESSSRQGAIVGGKVTKLKDLAMETDEAHSLTSPVATTEEALKWSHEARNLWLNRATCEEDLATVESLYRAALNAKKEFRALERKKKRKLVTGTPALISSYAALSPSDYRKAGEWLSLLYLQSGRPQKAKPGLKYLGFTCRLAEKILNYPDNRKLSTRQLQRKKKSKNSPPCCIMDEFLSNVQLKYLQSIFCDINADYWTHHNYAVEPPSPYFSYVLPISPHKQHQGTTSFLQSLIQQIFHCEKLRQQFPLLSKARYVELWAHNRPHACGHQMHFDSDNEGKGGVRNPIISTILYLSENNDVGGPSLITNQTLQSTSLSHVHGWLAYSKPLRMVAFDGKMLHGVIPGKGVVVSSNDNQSQSSQPQFRRVTLMLAFWKDIQTRDSILPGAARPWPKQSKDVSSWFRKLNAQRENHAKLFTGASPKVVDPVSIGNVYENLDGNPLPSDDAMPEYEQVFQGF
jgi:hypothetical protein